MGDSLSIMRDLDADEELISQKLKENFQLSDEDVMQHLSK